MRITALEVDGYGVWSGLRVERLADGLNVLYGPNEAGKTTLLQFIRAVLYGFSPPRRRYLPPLRGGRPGGRVEVAAPNGRFQIDRHQLAGNGEELILTAADGTRQGEHIVKVLLSNIDETVFNNVFAVGLREIQELATLSDTEAAQLLYNLSAGLDRVSLVEVMRELEASRNRILDRAGGPCHVTQLLADRERIRQEIEELDNVMRRYGRLAAEQSQLDADIARLEEERNHAAGQVRVIDLAVALRDRWLRRKAIDEELSALGPQTPLPDGALRRLDAIDARIGRRGPAIGEIARQRDALRKEGAALAVNEPLRRQAARIEALQEQEPWLATLQKQVDEIEGEVGRLKASLAAEQRQLGLDGSAGPLPAISPRMLASLRPAGRELRQCREQFAQAKQAVRRAEQTAAALDAQIEAALNARGQRDMAPAMDRAGNLVAQLRRRIQLDERLDQMTRYQRELEEQSRRHVDRQLLPPWIIAGLGAAFVLGFVLVLAGLFMPATMTGSIGWALAILGLLGSGAAALGKVLLERSNARQLDACQKQLAMLDVQIKQAGEDREALDAQLPRGGGPLAVRLAAAEKELAALEELAPLDGRRAEARHEAATAGERVAAAQRDFTVARRRWRDALIRLGLPPKLSSGQIRRMVRRCDQIQQLQRQIAGREEELGHRRRELDSLLGRITQLAADAGLGTDAGLGFNALDLLRQLGEALKQQKAHVARRETIRQQLRRLRRQQAKHEDAVSRLRQRRRSLFRECDARDEDELRRRVADFTRAEALGQERAALETEIAAAIGGHCPQEAVRQQIERPEASAPDGRRDEALARCTAIDAALQGRFQSRGQLAEQLRALAEDRRLAEKQLDLGVVEKQLETAVRRWQVLATTCRALEAIRASYEQQRQPETLREASGYLERLTQGRYCRVWTPLGEQVLRVDDAEGRSLPVEALSRGTREQLFLSLRLALGACYARRGAPLPLVLDDVLVNFDSQRAEAAAAVLRDFAAAGHQVLVFTCHEHILRMFQSLRVASGQLPSNADGQPHAVVLEQPAEEKPRRARKPAAPRKAAARIKLPEPPEDEDFVDDASDEAEIDNAAEQDVPWDGPSGDEEHWEDDEHYDSGGEAEAA